MTIAVNTRFLLKNKLEGIGWFTFETLQRLVKWHPEYQFIFFFDRDYDEKFIFAKNVTPVVLLPQARHPVLFYLWFEWAIPKALKKYKADVFLSPDGFMSLKTDVPTLLVIHDLAHVHFPNQVKLMEQWYYNYFMPRFTQKACRIATVSEYSKRDIIKQYQVNPDKIDVVYNGVRNDFHPLHNETKKTIKAKYTNEADYFLYVGAVHPRKNISRLIEAFDQFKKSSGASVQLLIAGRFAWQTETIRETWEKASFKKDIQFLQYVEDQEVPLLMGAALGLVYVSLFEGFGIPLVEAMHCEVPIITSNVSSMPEVVGDAGITVNPTSIEEISSAMKVICNDSNNRQTLITKGIKQREKFSWKQTARRLETILKKII